MRLVQAKIMLVAAGVCMGALLGACSKQDPKDRTVPTQPPASGAHTGKLQHKEVSVGSLRDRNSSKRAEYDVTPKPSQPHLNIPGAKTYPGDKIRPFKAQTYKGVQIDIEDYAGKIIVLLYWATWCRPCYEELPNMGRMAKEFGGNEDIVILGVALDKNSDQIDTFVEKYEMAFPQLFDGRAWRTWPAKLYGVISLPYSIIFNKEGRVHKTGLRGEELAEEIRTLLKAG